MKKLGRFTEPALTRVVSTSSDVEVQVRAQNLLLNLQAQMEGKAADKN